MSKRRNIYGIGSRFDNFEEQCALDLTREPAENMKDLLREITSKEEMSATKRMGYVNNFTKLIQNTEEKSNYGYSVEDILKCLRLPLISPAKEVRAAGLRALRHFFSDEKVLFKMIEMRVDIFIARSVDTKQAFEVERVQAIRFIRKVIAVCPRLCPMSLAAALVSIGNDNGKEPDRLRRACVETLCELAIKNGELASFCGGVGTIIRSVLDCTMPRLNESLVHTVLYLLNGPNTRSLVRSDVGLEELLAPFTDLHYRHSADIPDSHMKEDRLARYNASKMAIVSVFRSWAGIISLCKPDGSGLQSLLGAFCLSNSDVRTGIMDILVEIFNVKEPEWTDDFSIALQSIDPSLMQESWKLSEGFVAEEAKYLLPHTSPCRTNLVRNYMSLVLSAFVNAGLFESLVEVITSSDCFISVRATILLGQLLHMANTLLPNECSSHYHCLTSLVNTATSFEVSAAERARASAAVNCLDRLHQMSKRPPIPCSPYLQLIVTQTRDHIARRKADKSHKDKDKLFQYLNKDLDEPYVYLTAIRDTQVTTGKAFRAWNWDLISSLLQTQYLPLKKLEETNNLMCKILRLQDVTVVAPDLILEHIDNQRAVSRTVAAFHDTKMFIRNLLYFYKPKSQGFCTVPISDPQARTFTNLGILLLEYLLENKEQGLVLVQDFVKDIAEILEEVLQQSSKAISPVSNGVLSNNNVLKTLSRHYFLFLGKLSFSKNGARLLERAGVYQYLLELCTVSGRDCLLKLMVASLDYSVGGITRIILSKVLTASNTHTRLYATSHMRVLLRAKAAFFNNYGIEFLTTQLYDTDIQVATEAADVLDEACDDEANLQYLVQLRPVLLHLGEKGVRLLTRFVSVEKGFNYLNEIGYFTPLMDQWRTSYLKSYVKWVEESLAEALTTYTKPAEEGTYVRRTNKKHDVKAALLPPHFFGQMVQKKSGYKLLQKTNDVEIFASTIQTLEPTTNTDVSEIKAALWALGNIGSTNWGINLLMEEDIIPEIVRMAEECEHFAIRGTCFYVLGLIAKTRTGADVLKDFEWESIRHLGVEPWPVVEANQDMMQYNAWLMQTPTSVYTPFTLSSINESADNRNSSSVYMGEKPKAAEGTGAYDELSGIYLGEETVTRKPAQEDGHERGIITMWAEEAERRRKIVTRESGLYDDVSGVYLGDDKPAKPSAPVEQFTPGGILSKIQDSGFSLSEKVQQGHRRNRSLGVSTVSTVDSGIYLGDDGSLKIDGKPRTLSNIEVLKREMGDNWGIYNGESSKSTMSMTDTRPAHKHTSSVASVESLHVSRFFSQDSDVRHSKGKPNGSGDAKDPNDRGIPILHVRTNSGVSSTSEGSLDFLEPPSEHHSRTSSNTSDICLSASQQGSPSFPSLTSTYSDGASKALSDVSLKSKKATDSSSSEICGVGEKQVKNQSKLVNESEGKQGKKETPSYILNVSEASPSDHIQVARQRSISLTEKQRNISPTLDMIPETRSASFHGSTEFNKINSKKPQSRSNSGSQDYGSNVSLSSTTEVKILKDKTIIFRTGLEKVRALSMDSANMSNLRRDRILQAHGGSQTSNEESETTAVRPGGRTRGSSIEKADYARRLGLKSGDIAKGQYKRSSSASSSYSASSPERKKIVNKNRVCGSAENMTVISGDFRKNVRASSDVTAFTSTRDAFGYVALSSLRRQRSFNRDLENKAKVNVYNPRSSPWPFSRSVSVDMSTYKRDSLSSSSSSFDFRHMGGSTTTPTNNEFIGVCLPLELSNLFQVKSYDFRGSWPDHFVANPTALPSHRGQQPDLPEGHEPKRCLACMHCRRTRSFDGRKRSVDYFTDGKVVVLSGQTAENADADSLSRSLNSNDSSSTPLSVSDSSADVPLAKKLDETSPSGRVLVRKELINLIVSLSSGVASKANMDGLLKLKCRFPKSFEDLCMYCDVFDLLSLYKYKLDVRRFIHTLFNDVDFSPVVELADKVVNKD